MAIYPVFVNNRLIEDENSYDIYMYSRNSDQIEVTFDEEWSGYSKQVVFSLSDGGKGAIYDLDANNRCTLPASLLRGNRRIYYSFIGRKGDIKITTSEKGIAIMQTLNSDDSSPSGFEDESSIQKATDALIAAKEDLKNIIQSLNIENINDIATNLTASVDSLNAWKTRVEAGNSKVVILDE